MKYICSYFVPQFTNEHRWVLSPLIKYPVTFFLILAIGYTQTFAHVHRLNSPPSSIKKNHATASFHRPGTREREIDEVYIEENENKPRHTDFAPDFVAHTLELDIPFPQLKNHSPIGKYSWFSFFAAPDSQFRVLRLWQEDWADNVIFCLSLPILKWSIGESTWTTLWCFHHSQIV